MPRNGSGVYSLPGTYEATPGETILAVQHNDPLEDLQQDANTARPIVAGGTGASSAADARTALGAAGLTDENTFTKRQTWAKGANIASASTLTLGTDGNYFHVTGTTTITALSGSASPVLLTFDGALTLTHNGTSLILPGAANVTTAAGDTAIFVSEGSGNWRCLSFQRGNGRAFDAGKGTDVASATTVALGAGTFFHITGTTSISDIDFATAYDGRWAVLEFDGILTLTHNATTLTIPGGESIVTAAGDRAFIVQDDSDNIHVMFYQKAANGPGSTTTGSMAVGGAVSYDVAVPAWARVIHIGIDNISPSSSSIPRLQLGDSGGIETSGYTGGASFIGGSNVALSAGFDLVTTGVTAAMVAEVTLVRRTSTTWNIGGSASFPGNGQTTIITGSKATTDVTTALRLTNSAGVNFNNGGAWVVTFIP